MSVFQGRNRLIRIGAFVVAGCLFLLAACSNQAAQPPTTATAPDTTVNATGAAVTSSDPIVTLQIQSINLETGTGIWRLDVLVVSAANGSDLPTPVNDSLGKVVTVMSDQNLSGFKANDVVNAKLKDVGDPDQPSAVVLYIYDVVKP